MICSPDDLDIRMNWPSGTSAKHQRNHMEGYADASNPRCKLCTYENRSEIEQELYSGDMTPDLAAKIVGSSKEQVVRHIKQHTQPLVQKAAAHILAVKEVNEIDTLSGNISRLEGKLDQLMDSDDLDAKYIDSLTKLAKEVRESLKYLMEFKGKLVHKRQDTVIIHQMQIIKEVLAQNHPEVWLDVRKQMEDKLQ
jgi:hypothetical protein|tara:strand:- start:475 stop:1059 length:585 start_codon:yes stop_codon:yes gene_type:complete